MRRREAVRLRRQVRCGGRAVYLQRDQEPLAGQALRRARVGDDDHVRVRFVGGQVGLLPDAGAVDFAVELVAGRQRRLHRRERQRAVIPQCECQPHDHAVEALVVLVQAVERDRGEGREVAEFHRRGPVS